MTPDRQIITIVFDWRGIVVSVEYEAEWVGGTLYPCAHLAIRSVLPIKARLPITETGYRSHFVRPGEVEEADGVEAYVRTWLDIAANSREWVRFEAASRQYSLF